MAVAVGLDAYAVPKKDGYKLVWKDNFDGSALNRDYWNVEVNGSGCGNNELQYYVDNADKPYLSAAIGKNSDKHAFFNKANFLLFNLAVGGDFPNIHNADNVTAIPAGGAEMLVDYVRVYQPKKQISLNIKK